MIGHIALGVPSPRRCEKEGDLAPSRRGAMERQGSGRATRPSQGEGTRRRPRPPLLHRARSARPPSLRSLASLRHGARSLLAMRGRGNDLRVHPLRTEGERRAVPQRGDGESVRERADDRQDHEDADDDAVVEDDVVRVALAGLRIEAEAASVADRVIEQLRSEDAAPPGERRLVDVDALAARTREAIRVRHHAVRMVVAERLLLPAGRYTRRRVGLLLHRATLRRAITTGGSRRLAVRSTLRLLLRLTVSLRLLTVTLRLLTVALRLLRLLRLRSSVSAG